MRLRRAAAALSAAVLAGGSGVAYLARTPGGGGSYTITADVEQAPNLFPGGRVMVRGVQVGEITEVEPRPDGVRLTLEVDDGVEIPAGASLSVIPITIIADRYVQLVPPYEGGAVLEDGAHIPMARTSIPAELDQVLTQLKELVDALDKRPGEARGPLARLIEASDEALAGRAGSIAKTLETSSSVLANLAGSQSDITELIQNLDELFVALANRSSEIGLVNERFALVAEALAADQEHLEGTIENLALFSDEAAGLVLESGDRLGESFGRLREVLNTILDHQDSLTKGIRWTNSIAQALGEVDANGRGKYAYAGRQAAPGAEGAEHNYRIDQRDTIACERIDAITRSFLVLNPGATVEQAASTFLDFIPDFYDDDLRFLVEALIPFCSLIGEQEQQPVTRAARSAIEEVVAEVGEERFVALLALWFFEGYAPEASP